MANWTNWDIRKIVEYLINKPQTGNVFGVDEYNTVINHTQMKLFNRRLGPTEEYQQFPITKQSYAVTERIIDSLGTFIVEATLNYVNGVVSQPSDYIYPISNKYKLGTNTEDCDVTFEHALVELVDENEFMMREMSELVPISIFYPVYKIVGQTFKIYPSTLTYSTFNYLRKPTTAVMAVTLDSNDNEVYNAAGSTELDWNDADKLEIINMILGDAGLNLRSEDIIQASNQLKATGL